MFYQELNEGDTCQTYSTESQTQTYGHCIQQEFKKAMKTMFGCLPPWIPVSDEEDGRCPLKIKDFYNISSEVPHNLFNLMDNQKILDFCKPPCLKMDIRLERIMHLTQRVEESGMEISWPNTVQVMKKISRIFFIFRKKIQLN
jgi:hypothetical protein